MAQDYLVVGDPNSTIPKPCIKQFMCGQNGSVAALNSNGQVIALGLFTQPLFDLGNGIWIAPFDIIKGIIFGILTKFGVEPMFNKKPVKTWKAFKNGFVVGGVIGGLENVIDPLQPLIDGQPIDITVLTHEVLEILVMGSIAGTINALLTWAKI